MGEGGATGEMLETLDIGQIMECIPHRVPFLLIDRVIVESDVQVTAHKGVTINEPFFQGHFPGQPVMPGVLIVEAMAQSAAVLVAKRIDPTSAGKLVYFMTIDGCRFRRPVVPGDRLEITVVKTQGRRNVYRFEGTARVDGRVVAETRLSAMIMDGEPGSVGARPTNGGASIRT